MPDDAVTTRDAKPSKIQEFAVRAVADVAGAGAVMMAAFGDRLGLFKDLSDRGPGTSAEIAARLGLDERYVREWLGGMRAVGYLVFDSSSGRFSLPPEHAPILANEHSRFFMGPIWQFLSTVGGDFSTRVTDAFRTGRGIRQFDYPEEMVEVIARLSSRWFENVLVQEAIPAMPDVESKLLDGANVADVGCGSGVAVILLAQAYPSSNFVGYDVFPPAVEEARRRAKEADVQDRVSFDVLDVSNGLPGTFDVITTFDVLHDSSDPPAIVRAIHDALAPEGRYVCVEMNCSEKPEENVGPIATLMYSVSIPYCLSVSLGEGGDGLGTLGLPELTLRRLTADAGFHEIRRLPLEDPLRVVYELIPDKAVY